MTAPGEELPGAAAAPVPAPLPPPMAGAAVPDAGLRPDPWGAPGLVGSPPGLLPAAPTPMTAPSGLVGLPPGADDEGGGGVLVGMPEAGVCGGGGGDRIRLTESGAIAVGGRGGLFAAGDSEPEPGFWESPDGIAAPVGLGRDPGDDAEGDPPGALLVGGLAAPPRV